MTDSVPADLGQAQQLTDKQAREYAIEHGGATFKVCPVCDAHFPRIPLMLLEAQLRQHCEAHTAEEYLTVINSARAELAALARVREFHARWMLNTLAGYQPMRILDELAAVLDKPGERP